MDFNYKDITFIKLPLDLEGKVFAVQCNFTLPPTSLPLVVNHYVLVMYIEYIPKKMLEEPSE